MGEAKKAAASAKTANELRIALALLLPAECGLTLSQTADVLGRSVSWVARQRKLGVSGPRARLNTGRGGRRNALLTPDEEVELVKLAVVMSNRPRGGGIAKQLAALVHERKKVRPSPSTAYGILERVTARLFPGQKPTYLNERSGHLTRLWLPELPDEQRRRYALFFRF